MFFLFLSGNGFIFAQEVVGGIDSLSGYPSKQNNSSSLDRRDSYDLRREIRAAEQRAWEAEQRRMEEARIAAIRARPSSPRKPNTAGFQSPVKLNQALDALQPGASIELHGDLFTAFDGMILSATYYRGANGKDSVPVVLLHGKGGSRSDFDPIISELLKAGMAVLVPDIRGHGNSIEYIVEEFGEPYPRYHPEFPPQEIPENPFTRAWLPERWADYQLMSNDIEAGLYQKPPTRISMKRYDIYDDRDFLLRVFDMQVWQNFLINENNQERLNIRKLNLVGTEMGAGLAVHWCRSDQAGAKLTKTMTLISPVVPANAMDARGIGTYLGYLNNAAMKNSLSTMIIYGGKNQRFKEDAEKVKATLLGKGNVDNETGLKAKYPLIPWDTEKQGRDLFSLASAPIDRGIPLFIKDRLGQREVEAAEKKNDKTLVWARIGSWNILIPPPAEKPARATNTTRPTGTSKVTTPTGTRNAANREN